MVGLTFGLIEAYEQNEHKLQLVSKTEHGPAWRLELLGDTG